MGNEREMSVTIRILGPTDATLLDDVAAEVFDYPIDARSTGEFLADPRHHLAVAVEKGQVVGMASAVHYVHPDKPPELWVNEIGVAPTHRRKGIGRLVLEALLERGHSLGCQSAWVLSEISDIQARHFYAAVGGQESPVPLVMVEFDLSGRKAASVHSGP